MHLTASNLLSTLEQYPLMMDLDFIPQMDLALDFLAGVLMDFLQERLSQRCSQQSAVKFNLMHLCHFVLHWPQQLLLLLELTPALLFLI